MQAVTTIKRIQSLTDSLFAIAMTFLVLAFKSPERHLHHLTSSALHKFLFSQFTELYSYVISFILLAIFWIDHHWHFSYIKKTNHTQLWINILFLLFVALVPYTTSLSGFFYTDWLVQFSFCFNITIICLLIAINWNYSCHKVSSFKAGVTENMKKAIHKKNMTVLMICILSTICSFIVPFFAPFILMFIPFSTLHYRKLKRNELA